MFQSTLSSFSNLLFNQLFNYLISLLFSNFNNYENFIMNHLYSNYFSLGFHSSASEHIFISSADEAMKDALSKKKKKLRKTKKNSKIEPQIYDFHDDQEMTAEYFRELIEPKYQSAFTDFVTGKLKLTEEDEAYLQELMDSGISKKNTDCTEELRKNFYSPTSWSPMKRYSRIASTTQSAMHRVFGKEHVGYFFSDLETYLEDFILKQRTKAVIIFKDPYQRYLAHGIIKYYLLHSKSVDYQGDRITVIQTSSRLRRLQAYNLKHPKKGRKLILPQLRLYHFLAMLYSHSPQEIDKRVLSGETFFIPNNITISQLNVSDMESGFDSSTRRISRRKNSKRRKLLDDSD